MTAAATTVSSTRLVLERYLTGDTEPEHLSTAPPGPPRATSFVTQQPAASSQRPAASQRRPRADGSVSQHSVKLMPGYVAKSAACTDTRGCTRTVGSLTR